LKNEIQNLVRHENSSNQKKTHSSSKEQKHHAGGSFGNLNQFGIGINQNKQVDQEEKAPEHNA